MPDIKLDKQDKEDLSEYDGYKFLSGVYAHGKVEDGFDLIWVKPHVKYMISIFLRWYHQDVGIIIDNLSFSSPNHNKIPVKLLIWKYKNFNDYILRGFVVAMDDKSNMEWVYGKYKERVESI